MTVLPAIPQYLALLVLVLPYLVFSSMPTVDIPQDFGHGTWVNLTVFYLRVPYNLDPAIRTRHLSQFPFINPGNWNISSFCWTPRQDINWDTATRDIPYVGLGVPLSAAEHLSQYGQQGVTRRDALPSQASHVSTIAPAPPSPFDAILFEAVKVISKTYDGCAMNKAVWETTPDQLRGADSFSYRSDDWLIMNGRRFDVQGAAKILLDDAAMECVGAVRAAANAYLQSLPGQRHKRRLIKRQASLESSETYVSKKLDALVEEMINKMFPATTPARERSVQLVEFMGAQTSAIYEAKDRVALDRIKGLEEKRANGTHTVQDDTLFNQTQAYRIQVGNEFENELVRITAEERSTFDSAIGRVFTADLQGQNVTQTGSIPATQQLNRRADLPAGLPPAGRSADGLPPADLPAAGAAPIGAPPVGAPPAAAAAPPAGVPPVAGAAPASPQIGSTLSTTNDIIEDSRRSRDAQIAREAGERLADARAEVPHGTVARIRSQIAEVAPVRNAKIPGPQIVHLYREDLERTQARTKATYDEARNKLRSGLTDNQKRIIKEKVARGESNLPRPATANPPVNDNVQAPSNNLQENQAAREARMNAAIDQTAQRQADEIRKSGKSPAKTEQDLRSLDIDTKQAHQAVADQQAKQVAMEKKVAQSVGNADSDAPRSRPRPRRSFEELSSQYRENRAAVSQSEDVARATKGKARTQEAELAKKKMQFEAYQRTEARLAEEVKVAEGRGENPVERYRQLGETRDWMSENRVEIIQQEERTAAAEQASSSADKAVVEAVQGATETSEDLVLTAGTPEEVASAQRAFLQTAGDILQQQEGGSNFIEEYNVVPREDWNEIRSRIDSVIEQPVQDEAGMVSKANEVEELRQQVQALDQRSAKAVADYRTLTDRAATDMAAITDANAMTNAKVDEMVGTTNALIEKGKQQLQSETFSAADLADIEAAVEKDEAAYADLGKMAETMRLNQQTVAGTLDSHEPLLQDVDSLAESQASWQAELEQLEQSSASRDVKFEEATEKARDFEARAQAAENALHDAENRVLQLEQKTEKAREASADAFSREQGLKSKIAKMSQQIEQLKEKHSGQVEGQKRRYRTDLDTMEEQLRRTAAERDAHRSATEASRNELEQVRSELAEARKAHDASKSSEAGLQTRNELLNEELRRIREGADRSRLGAEIETAGIQSEGTVLRALTESEIADGVVAAEVYPRNRVLVETRMSNRIPGSTGLVDKPPPSVPGSPPMPGNGSPDVVDPDPLPSNPESPPLGDPRNPAELPADWPPEISNPELLSDAPPTRPPPEIPIADLPASFQELGQEAEATIEYAERNNMPEIVERTQATLNEIHAETQAVQEFVAEVAASGDAGPIAADALEAAISTNVAAALTQTHGMVEILPAGFDDTMSGALWNPARVALRSNEATAQIARMEALDRHVNERLTLQYPSPAERAALVSQSQEIQQSLADLRVSEVSSRSAAAAADASLIGTVGSLARLETFCWNRIGALEKLIELKNAGTGFRAGLTETISALEAAGAGSAGADAQLAQELKAMKSLLKDLTKGSKEKYGYMEEELSAIFKALDKGEKASAEVVEVTTEYRATIEALTGVASRASQAIEASPRGLMTVAEGLQMLRSGLGAAGGAMQASAAAKVSTLVKSGRLIGQAATESYEAIKSGTVGARVAEVAIDAGRMIRAGGAISSLWNLEIMVFTAGEVALSETGIGSVVIAAIEVFVLAITSAIDPILHGIMDPRERDAFKSFWVDLDHDNILEKVDKWQSVYNPKNTLMDQWVAAVDHYYETTSFTFGDADPNGGLGDVTIKWKGDVAGNMAEGYALIAILKNKDMIVEDKAKQLFETLTLRNEMDNKLKSFIKIWADFDYNGKPGLTKIELNDRGGGLGTMRMTGNLWPDSPGRDKIVVQDLRHVVESCQDCVDDDD